MIYYYEYTPELESTTCQECGELIHWCDSDHVGGSTDDDKFSSVIQKLIHHLKNDPKCVRERKLKLILE